MGTVYVAGGYGLCTLLDPQVSDWGLRLSNRTEDWQRVVAQEKRPVSFVILDSGVFELVLEDASIPPHRRKR